MSEGVRKLLAGLFTVGLAIIVVVGIAIGDSTPRDRVQALGGSIEVDSRPGKGTAILVELPLQPD